MKQGPFGDGIEDGRAKIEGGHIEASCGVTARTKKKVTGEEAFA
jgi:hypothetical protein